MKTHHNTLVNRNAKSFDYINTTFSVVGAAFVLYFIGTIVLMAFGH